MQYLSFKMLEAYEFSAKAHKGQNRKNPGEIPYASHPAAVASILTKAGFSDEVIIAGLLHDTIEDTKYTEHDIRERFGDRVAAIVLGVTENKRFKWDERQRQYNEKLRTLDSEISAVSAADLLANRCSLLFEFKAGRNPWLDFSRNPKQYAEQRIRYDWERITIIQEKVSHPFVSELEDVERQIVDFTNQISSKNAFTS